MIIMIMLWLKDISYLVDILRPCDVIYIYKCIDKRLIGLVGRVCAKSPEELCSIPNRHTKDLMVLDTSLFNTQQYKVRIKGKVEQSRERSSALPYYSVL